MLTFDSRGQLLPDAFLQQQMAVAEGATAPALAPDYRDPIVLDESHRFIAQGGALEAVGYAGTCHLSGRLGPYPVHSIVAVATRPTGVRLSGLCPYVPVDLEAVYDRYQG